MPKHIHADLMRLYYEDAMETDKPWRRWEYRYNKLKGWMSLEFCGPTWREDHEYRRKPQATSINGFKVPETMRKTKVNCGSNRRSLDDIINEKTASPAILKMTLGKLSKRKHKEDDCDNDDISTLGDYFKHIPSDGSGLM